ncbi:MAG: DUF5906 domain-containing protein [Candidatus Adiutrix sp.]|jgi:putative DNA primase/helicase|nr:DUF5906 domain-containing protein [Candidatus Adiutrix sp.]
MSDGKPDYKELVEARVLEEAAGQEPAAPEAAKLPINFILDCLRHNRLGDATLYAALHRGRFVFVHLWARWLRFNGQHLEEDINSSRALAAVERVCEEYQRIFEEVGEAKDPDSDLAKAVSKRLNILRDKAGRENVLEMAAIHIDEPLAIEGDELDKQEYLLACRTGVIHVVTGECQQGKLEQYLLNACPVAWTGLDTPSPNFMAFLYSSLGEDEEMVRYMLRLLGYGLLGNRDEHIWAVFHGPRGRNGKDTLMKILFRVLGNRLAIRVPTAMLMQQTFQRSGSQPEPDIIALRGSKLAFASEGEASQKIAMSKLKDLTGGSIITARGINDKHMTSWQQTHLLFFLTNEVPKMKSDDDAFWTRSHFIHWPIRFVDDPQAPDERKKDPRIYQKMEGELSGILARLVEGCIDYLENGLAPPEKILAYTKEQREQFDDIGQFLREACLREDPPLPGQKWKTRIPAADLLAVCNWWSQKVLGNTYPYKPKGLTQALDKKGIINIKSNVTHYLGLSVKPEVRDEYELFLLEEKEKTEKRRS